MRFSPKVLLLLSITSLIFQPNFLPAVQEYILIKNAKVYTMAEMGVLEKGMILIKEGKIEKIGQNIDFPSESRVVDLSGKIIIPGIICASSSLFAYERDLGFTGEESPDTNILEGINYFDESIPEILKQGVTSVYIAPVSFRFIGGLGAVVKLKVKDKSALEVLKEKAGLKFRLERLQDKKTSNVLRLTQFYRIRNLFNQAQEYRKEWQDYEKKLKEYEEEQKDKSKKDKAKKPKKPKTDEGKEILVKAMKKEIPVRFEVHRPDAILAAMKLAEEFGLKIILEKCEDWFRVLPQIREAAVPILSNSLMDYRKFMIPGGVKGYAANLLKTRNDSFFYSDTLSPSIKIADEEDWNKLVSSEIPLALIPPDDFPLSARYMRFYASLLAANHVPVTKALRTITSSPAKILGVSDRVGSLEEGKDADLAILDGEPLSSLSKIEIVFINGSVAWKRKK